eukprot:SAG11_NODE_76_length_18005_cov_6.523958_9_plen_210_part_00
MAQALNTVVYSSLFALYSSARLAYFVGPLHVAICALYCWSNLAFREWFAPGIQSGLLQVRRRTHQDRQTQVIAMATDKTPLGRTAAVEERLKRDRRPQTPPAASAPPAPRNPTQGRGGRNRGKFRTAHRRLVERSEQIVAAGQAGVQAEAAALETAFGDVMATSRDLMYNSRKEDFAMQVRQPSAFGAAVAAQRWGLDRSPRPVRAEPF